MSSIVYRRWLLRDRLGRTTAYDRDHRHSLAADGVAGLDPEIGAVRVGDLSVSDELVSDDLGSVARDRERDARSLRSSAARRESRERRDPDELGAEVDER